VRRKLGAKPGEPGRIKTFQGIGYLLDVDGPGQATGGGGDSAAAADSDAPDAADTNPTKRPMDEAAPVA
jgi:hypothetical protein